MRHIFEETTLNHMVLSNRIVRSATWEGMCDDKGRPTQHLTQCYEALVRGGVGLIITGYAFVTPEGRQLPKKMGIHNNDFEDAFRSLTNAVHRMGGKVAMQLVHAGGQTDSKAAGRTPLAPSSVRVAQFKECPEPLTLEGIERIENAFAESADRAKNYGFDGVQLHGAHGYLINQFLSPLTNQREDEYGGSIDNRSRFLMNIYEKVREKVGKDYPVMIKLNASDYIDGGLSLEDSLYAASLLDKAGIDAIEVSSGTPASGDKGPVRSKIKPNKNEGYNLNDAIAFKKRVSCAVMSVGGFRTHEQVLSAIEKDGMDYIAFSRPFIREPHLVSFWEKGENHPARCISCNKCFGTGLKPDGIYCAVEKKEQKKKKM